MPLYLVRENRVGSEEQTVSNDIGGLCSESLLSFSSWPQETGKSGDEVHHLVLVRNAVSVPL